MGEFNMNFYHKKCEVCFSDHLQQSVLHATLKNLLEEQETDNI